MKAKNHTKQVRHTTTHTHKDDVLPCELGTHLFAIIRRNLLAAKKTTPAPAVQLTFAL